MSRTPIATTLLLATAVSGLGAQSVTAPLRVEGVGEPVSVGVAGHRGYAAYPAWTLRALGARVDGTPGGTRVVFAGDTLRFDAESAFFDVDGTPYQLVDAPYREGGVVYLPHQLFAEWLPTAYSDRVEFSGGRLTLRSAAVAAGESSPAPSGGAEDGEADPLGRPAVPLIVVDAGHGGKDPGRIGPSGLREKDVVLQVSKRLARVLAERGYEVRMTRTTDTLIGLYDRAPMANRWRGSRPGLFLSIHANGVSDRRVTGFETFFLSDARTEDERRVAEMENSAVEYESSSSAAPPDDLGAILNNLSNEFYVRASNSLAGLVQDELDDFHTGHNRGVKQAGFVVLVGAFMPAVLIETAFISNPREERLLGSGSFQVDMANSIADAVDRFFASHDEWSGGTP
jgi:N-acetylmuramoyl-L-alanine amidase